MSVSFDQKFSFISPLGSKGRIILTEFPGLNEEKKFSDRQFDHTMKSLHLIGCKILISLVEDSEFIKLCSKKVLMQKMSDIGIQWHHTPIKDYHIPNAEFLKNWRILSPELQKELTQGSTICLHCMGGLGRSGTVASILLIDLGERNEKVITRIRYHRKGAIENTLQENFVKNYKTSL